jgi:hypothetical protein
MNICKEGVTGIGIDDLDDFMTDMTLGITQLYNLFCLHTIPSPPMLSGTPGRLTNAFSLLCCILYSP